MPDSSLVNNQVTPESPDNGKAVPVKDHTRSLRHTYPYIVLAAFLFGVLTSYVIWGRSGVQAVTALQPAVASPAADNTDQADQHSADMAALIKQVNPAEGYTLPIQYGDLGPRLIQAGIIDYDAFAAIYTDGGTSLSQDEVAILQRGSEEQVTITAQNAHFLLNFFWAVGLANKNSILTEGPMVQQSQGQIEGYASTGGWGLASRPVTEIYASLDLIPLTEDQQRRVEEVAAAIYRPCCGNPTLFPDCNHGMAMLGLLELMASRGVTTDEMFNSAKYVNAFWFPQQTMETAVYLKATQNTEFADADARLVVGREYSSGAGSARVHQALQAAGLLEQAPGRGNSCAN